MKRRDLEKHLSQQGRELHYHGSRHDIWLNTRSLKRTSVPRHNEIKRGTIKSICEKLGVPSPI